MENFQEDNAIVPVDFIEQRIYMIRGWKVMLDDDLAWLYQISTKRLKAAVRRNKGRFPDDFILQLTREEFQSLRTQIASLKIGRGGRGYLPYAFTEQGVAMLSSVLRSGRAVAVNIAIMRTFVHLRQLLASNKELAEKVAEMEKKYDKQFKIVFDVLKQLMGPPSDEDNRPPMGFMKK